MATISDVSPLSASVACRGKSLDVYPLTMAHIGQLIAQYPNLVKILRGQADIVSSVMAEGEGAINFAIACALDAKVEDVQAARLNVSEQSQILISSVEISLPERDEDLVDFMNRLAALVDRVATAAGK